jgi:hypothetical protein
VEVGGGGEHELGARGTAASPEGGLLPAVATTAGDSRSKLLGAEHR